MRKLAPVLVGLGGFLLVAGLVAALWAPGVVKKTPLDVDSLTLLEGQAARLDSSTGELGEARPIVARSVSQVDSEASDDDYAVFTSSQCAFFAEGDTSECAGPQDPRALSLTDDVFATDRVTALSSNDAPGLPDDAQPHEGLVNKWPFDAERTTYPYWDGTTAQAVDAVFDRTEEVDGLEVYVYSAVVEDAPIEILEGTPGTYSSDKEIWVDPATGSIINQVDSQQRSLDDGTQVLDLDVAFTAEQVTDNVAAAQDSASSLRLITFWVPVVGIVGGVLLLAGGLVALARSRRRPTGSHAPDTRVEQTV